MQKHISTPGLGWKRSLPKKHATLNPACNQAVYVDGLPEYATFDDYSEMCVFFDLNKDDDLDKIFGIIDSIKLEKSE